MASKAKEQLQTTPAEESTDKPVKQLVKEAFEAGKTRREIADEFELSYQRVYQLTKGLEGTAPSQARPRVAVESSEKIVAAGREDLIGMPRVEAIRMLFNEGMKLGDISRLLGTTYQICFQATRAIRAGEVEEPEEAEAEDLEDEGQDEDADEG